MAETDLLSDDASIEELKARYAELKASGQQEGAFEAKVATAPSAPEIVPADTVLERETIPGGWYWTTIVKKGQTLRLTNPAGTPGAALQIWNLRDPSERFNSADTIKVQWTARISKGRVLLSDMGRAIMGITEDTGGYNDCIAGHSTVITNEKAYGPGYRRNSRDNFLIAAAKLGMSRRDLHQSFSPFAGVATDADGKLAWVDGCAKPGAFIDLRAEMDVRICLSNCPHPMDPSRLYAPTPIQAVVWDAGPVTADDLCRTGTNEAIRAYENTDRMGEI